VVRPRRRPGLSGLPATIPGAPGAPEVVKFRVAPGAVQAARRPVAPHALCSGFVAVDDPPLVMVVAWTPGAQQSHQRCPRSQRRSALAVEAAWPWVPPSPYSRARYGETPRSFCGCQARRIDLHMCRWLTGPPPRPRLERARAWGPPIPSLITFSADDSGELGGVGLVEPLPCPPPPPAGQ